MPRPPLPPGVLGSTSWLDFGESDNPERRFRAQANYRLSVGGKLKTIEGRGRSKRAAERVMKARFSAVLTAGEVNKPERAKTLSDILEPWHEERLAGNRVRYQTQAEYRRVAQSTIMPVLGDIPLTGLTTGKLTRFLQGLVSKDSGYSLAHQSRVVLRSMLGWAVREGLVAVNAAREAEVPRRPTDAVVHTPRALTTSEVARLREAAVAVDADDPHRPGMRSQRALVDGLEIMLATGLRIGELMALRWSDVDLTSAPPTLTVRGTVVSKVTPGSAPARRRQSTGKTVRATRTIVLSETAADVLRDRQARMPESPVDAIFLSRNGAFMTPSGWRARLRRARKIAGLEDVTPHTLRDTVATRVSRDIGIEVAAAVLGHASEEVTRRHYVDVTGRPVPDPRAALAPLEPGAASER